MKLCTFCRCELGVPEGYEGPMFCSECFARYERDGRLLRVAVWSILFGAYFYILWLAFG